jgi:crotonobetainyl-CoA:carnitine CoA-transferase CaiB-like acyl-CoA transferase
VDEHTMNGSQAAQADSPGPLSGVRVIDWTIWQQGPIAGTMLGDLGAEVIKIEERQGGDSGRTMFVFPESGASPYWELLNRNKRSLAVDLKKREGLELVRRLIGGADVFIQNFRPSVAEKLGLDYDSLRALNPRLIYGCATAFGSRGPEGRARAYDLLGQARAGLLLRPGYEDEPGTPDSGLADQMGGIMLAYGVLAALVARGRDGLGQRVESSLFGSMMWLRGLPVALAAMTENGRQAVSPVQKHIKSTKKYSRLDPGNPLWNTYKCGDGKWLAMAILQSDPHWPVVLEALGAPEALAGEPRFASHVSRCENASACVAILDELFATQPREEWLRRLTAKGDLPVSPINTTADAVLDPMAIANDYVVAYDHPALGRVQVPGFPVALSETPPAIRRKAPAFGEHTEEILLDELQLGWEEIAGLREREVI